MSGEPTNMTVTVGSVSELVNRFDLASSKLRSLAQDVSDRSRFDDCWVDVLDVPPTEKTYAAGIVHLVTHSMHHRAQLLYMLRQLRLPHLPEGDVFSWVNRAG
jgi:uncharacterized damage-inducible protein DinB